MFLLPFHRTLLAQGSLLIISGLSAYIIIGPKAINMLLASVVFGLASWSGAWLSLKSRNGIWISLGTCLAGTIIFANRCIANLLSLIGIIQHEMNADAYNKCIAVVLFLIMTVICVCSLLILYTYLPEKENK